jgi:hypothetical protein
VADNVTANPGAGGATLATDDIGGVQYPRSKLVIGADGVNDGDVSAANPLPVRVQGVATRTNGPLANDNGLVMRQAPLDVWSVGFARVGSGLLEPEMTQRALGTGVTVSQSTSNLVVAAGTTVNAEFLARSVASFRGAFLQRHRAIVSQRIANNNLAVMMADRIGEGLACTINSATSITVTAPAHGFTSQNVGQSMFVGAIVGAAGVPGRYAIASVPTVDTITFTVAGWPASGSCTVDLFGWNYFRTLYNGTVVTTALVDAQRRGWNSGDTSATINTTASPGHVMQTAVDGRNAYWSDSLVASSATPNFATRAHRIENLPDDDVELFLYVWSFNGAVAPASSTSWTIGFVAVEDTTNVAMYVAGFRPTGNAAPLPVAFPTTPTVTVGTLPATPAGANTIGGVRLISDAAQGASTTHHLIAAAGTNATSVKTSAGNINTIVLSNASAAARYFKLCNLAAAPTPGTSTPVMTVLVPAGQTVTVDCGPFGIRLATGIAYHLTTGIAVADTGALAAADMSVAIFYT